jgi:hypothetical protein
MGLRDKIPVEPLPEPRWAQIERSVFAQLDRDAKDPLLQSMADISVPHRRSGLTWRHGLVAALSLAATVILVVAGLRFLALQQAATGASAANPSRIVTGTSESHLAVGESSIDVEPQSAALVSGDDAHGILVVLDRGGATFEIAPRHGRPPVIVQAGDVRVRVIGTRFTVTRDGDGARVAVEHGTVEVSANGKTALVHAGEQWPSATLTSAAPLSPPDSQPEHSRPARPNRTVPSPVPHVPPAALHPSPLATSLPESFGRTPSAPAADNNSFAPPPDATDDTPAAAPPPPPPPSPRELFETAAQIEGREPARAIGIYQQLAAAGGVWGMNALFAWARLEYDRGNRGAAAQLLNQYLARYPRGPNAADARALLEHLR